MARLDDLLYPRLAALPEGERPAALERARRTAFDVIELVGIALGLVVATAVTRYGAAELGPLERVGAAAANFILAVPLLALLVGPFLVRRVRRGLERELSGRR